MIKKSLKDLLREKKCLRVIETVNGLEAIIVKNAEKTGKKFDALWLSGLCHAAQKGMPDNGQMPLYMKLSALNEIRSVTSMPILIDCDTGGSPEELTEIIKLCKEKASAVIIEDKKGVKRNSLYGALVKQEMEDIEVFSEKIRLAKAAADTDNIMIFARLESLIAGESQETALIRAEKYIMSGADGIVIHSIDRSGAEIFEFTKHFRSKFKEIPLVMIPTVYNSYSFEELQESGANIVIYANQLTRSACKAMIKTAESILETGRSQYADDNFCISPKELLQMIEEE